MFCRPALALWFCMALVLLGTALPAQDANEPRRFALVIGINRYADPTILPLQKAQNDAEAMATLLSTSGSYKSVKLMMGSLPYTDPLFPSRDNVIAQVDQLAAILKPGDQVLFFFSGHGLSEQSSGNSLLLTIDARTKNFSGSALNLQKDVLDKLESAKGGKVIALVDACQKTITNDKGLSVVGVDHVAPRANSVVITATSLGKASYEDPAGNFGLFTKGLLTGLSGAADQNGDGEISLAELEGYLPDTVSEFAFEANLSQTPSVFDANKSAGAASLGKPGKSPLASPGLAAKIQGDYKIDGTNFNGSKYGGICTIAYNPDKTYSFTWKIGSDVYRGVGQLEGKVLTVDWGQTDPVIYQVSNDGKRLDGLWDKGNAKETLTR